MRVFLTTMYALLVALLCARAQPSEQTVSKAVLVTGASSGIGRKITERLAADGYFVYATARKEEDLKSLAAIKNVQPVRLDVTVPADIAAAVELISKAGRGLYGLVNNAGIGTIGTVDKMNLEEFDLTLKVNVYGPVLMVRAFLPMIIAQNGRIVNIGSASGILAGATIPAYVMSKHAIEGLTDSLAAQLAPLGVHVSVFEPGNYQSSLDKNLIARLPEEERPAVIKAIGPAMDQSQFPQADDLALAVEQALFGPNPKRRYMMIPQPSIVEKTIRKQIEQLVQLNEGHAHTYDREALIKMLDEALATARPRT